MAIRRCIDCRLVNSVRFLNMSKSAQALYQALISNADDDGIVEGGFVLRAAGIRKTALTELSENGYVAVLEPGNNVVWIVNWQSFNTVDTRYGHPSNYRRTLLEHFPNITLPEFKGKNNDIPTSDTRKSEVKKSEEKKSEVKSSEVKEITIPDWHPFGDYDLLTTTDFSDPDTISALIQDLNIWASGTCDQLAKRFIELNQKHQSENWTVKRWQRQLEGFLKSDKTAPDAEEDPSYMRHLEPIEDDITEYILYGRNGQNTTWSGRHDREVCTSLADYFSEAELDQINEMEGFSSFDECAGFDQVPWTKVISFTFDSEDWTITEDDWKPELLSKAKEYIKDFAYKDAEAAKANSRSGYNKTMAEGIENAEQDQEEEAPPFSIEELKEMGWMD